MGKVELQGKGNAEESVNPAQHWGNACVDDNVCFSKSEKIAGHYVCQNDFLKLVG